MNSKTIQEIESSSNPPFPLRVLILEDREDDVELVIGELRRAGFEPTWQRVETETDFVAHMHEQIQVILADYSLPQFNAPRALQLLRERGLDIPFIVVSSSISEQVIVGVMKLGATDYLFKDRLARLGSAVSHALEEKRLRDEKRRVDEALHENEGRFRALVERSSDAIALASPDGTILYVTPGAARIVGITPEKMVGRSTFDGIHPDDLERAKNAFSQVLQNPGSSVTSQFRFRHRDGSWRWVEGVGTNMLHEPGVQAMVANYRDITERKRAEEEIRQRAAHQTALNGIIAAATEASTDLQILLETALDLTLKAFSLEIGAIWLSEAPDHDAVAAVQGVTHSIAEAMANAALLERENLVSSSVVSDWENVKNRFGAIVLAHGIRASIAAPLLAEGKRIGGLGIASAQPRQWSQEEVALTEAIGRQQGIAIERARLLSDAREHVRRLELLYDAGLSLNQMVDLPSLMESLLNILNKIVLADRTDFFRLDPAHQTLATEFGVGYAQDFDITGLHAANFQVGEERGLVGLVAANRTPVYIADLQNDPRWIPFDPSIRSGFWLPVERQGELRGVLVATSTRADAFSHSDQHLVRLFGNQLAVALENVRLFDETRRRLAELESVNRISSALRVAQTLDEMLPILLKETLSVMDATAATVWLYDPVKDELTQVAESGFPHLSAPLKPNEGIAGHVFTTGQVYFSPDFKSDPHTTETKREQVPAGLSGICVPIRAADQIIGVFFVSVHLPRQLKQDEIDLLTTVAEMAGNAIHRTRLHEQTEEQLRHLASLHHIDRAITSSFDMHVTFNVILDQVITELQVDAADILLLKPFAHALEYGAGRGFRTSAVTHARLDLGEAYAGRIAFERRALKLSENIAAGASPAFRRFIESEDFVFYYGVPLVAKGKVKGVLEIFHRRPLVTTPEWLTFIDALAEQTAIAVDNAVLLTDLERSNMELTLAYDTTLEGWSHAMDLRDKETEGHTQRVTEMTLRLAHAMGISEVELVHIRRGALMHDMGKMGVPDRILLKPGPLTDGEWEIMRKHPTYAYEMLMPIQYLQPALDIPYCHHEKWDGTGYPRGLKGEEIPLAARIFAVVDVWDALRSDRPYRHAWSDSQVRQHLRESSGKYFDPKVIEVFLAMLEPEEE